MTKPTTERQAETEKMLDEYLRRHRPNLTTAERKTRVDELFGTFSSPPPVELPPPEEEQ